MGKNWVSGVYVGPAIAAGVHAEKVGDGRWVIRRVAGDTSRRLGEVMGGVRSFQALTMRGERVGEGHTMRATAAVLAARGPSCTGP